MHTLTKQFSACNALRGATAALTALLCLSALPPPTLEGRWKLVEQRYGSGSANLVSIEAPLHLEFTVSGGRLIGRIWAAEDRSKALGWPALFTEHGPRPIEVRQVSIQAGSNLARAVYRVAPASADGDVLEIAEEYRMAEGGTVLSGTVTVTALGKCNPVGSYTLHRRFEREP
ncbi:MAG: hypothetical protein L0Z52_00495 [Acidobacteria bacterium]|nr:hypothetical protein [Acidobacteriota bacterium]